MADVHDLFLVAEMVVPKRARQKPRPASGTISFWAVRHKPTGWYLPEVYGRQGRGGSHVEPTNLVRPRLFISQRAAKAYLGQWLLGKHNASRGYDSGSPYSEPEYWEEVSVEPVATRKREEMEIIELKLDIP
jgi:hypothetical protein